ncbi:hypothetical protein KKG58_02250 [Patescibacteria group bacterium]|nr:hypothetical protein [Patescibacteria group bacterium]
MIQGPEVERVLANKDFNKVDGGDIMITSMTRQDFVPAIRKYGALVTNEGSVICRAAIIAREFEIPCIVNTKIGTKLFKPGDLVEVDADRGMIKILKRGKNILFILSHLSYFSYLS